MNDLDIPIFKKTYELYKTFYAIRQTVPKQDRYALWQKCENMLLDIMEHIMIGGQVPKQQKLPFLEKASTEINMFRIFVRLAKDIKAIDTKKYILLQEHIDEIGRMLGGWIKSIKDGR
ncbi:hypothetical protein A2333_02055 [Candidatus Wolfebacteria bacterium RIFOXYB2_FULL_49_7]|uniref:bAvd-like domain-containing protein n=1 Tax=Candidatus Wolfebacteria bacterium RIFOXYB1_FULL_54_12 TaxID=1802559 RepID=A0A1F8DVY6_9BACT|nr:MAG: hypothetical protein A2372_01125 [Candidatus Wolfebacteria bacterium RIFOXYB1_FULL_54_12]OGM93959.1 MAG: hypothetical protein A2333_02055 [Candidatus Wolfebacteria bacterium RIFOXYB2_FULL_49_7]